MINHLSQLRGACLALAASTLLLAACSTLSQDGEHLAINDPRLHATYWLQVSAEHEGAALQAYSLGRTQLDAALADPKRTAAPEQIGQEFEDLPPAIILDVDETVLDNTPYNAWLVQEGKEYTSDNWSGWVHAAMAPPIPGALALTQYAASKGVTVFYVTNRDAALEAPTKANLEKFGFPIDTAKDVLLMKREKPNWGSEKGTRRAEIAKTHRILLLFGDNLGDFTDGIRSTPKARAELVKANADQFGTNWIVIANPVYGSWEDAAFGFDYALPRDVRMQGLADGLEPWTPAP